MFFKGLLRKWFATKYQVPYQFGNLTFDILHLKLPFYLNWPFRDTITLVFFFVLRIYFQDFVQKTAFYTFFSCFFLPVTSLMLRRLMFVIPSLLYTDFIMTQMSYLTWILDLAIFRRKKIIFCIFYIFNVQYQLRGSFKDTFTLGFFWFWSSISKILSKKQTCTHFSADFFLPVHSLMLRRVMFEIPGLTGHDEKSYELWLFYL